jgi:hypothetical protein
MQVQDEMEWSGLIDGDRIMVRGTSRGRGAGPGRAGAVRCGQAGSGGRAHGGRGQPRVRLRRPLLRDFASDDGEAMYHGATVHVIVKLLA